MNACESPNAKPFFTIIIPVKEINDYVFETVSHIQNFPNNNWELIILPNAHTTTKWQDERIRISSSGSVGPAQKRDLGATLASGNILVFLDDDSYPEKNLLLVAERYFQNNAIVAIGGPAITPPQDSFWQKVSGAVFLSRFSGGAPERYIAVGQAREIQDWPSVNLMVRKTDFLDIGGFNSPYWPGEDTKLCLDLIQKTKKKIIYVPELIVWHHRRPGLIPHLKQIGNYGLHRGYFAKVYPQTSRKIHYFIPSAFVLFIGLSTAYSFSPDLLQKFIKIGWSLYSLAIIKAFVDIVRKESLLISLAAVFYTFFTHIYYGIRFAQGLLTVKLISKLR